MIASWVSQASFLPPGITVAIAKKYAFGTLLHIDDYFALNVLADGRSSMLLKRFHNTDYFPEQKIEYSPNGQPLLPEALAWLEGEVKERMECGDHWLIYAEIRHGGLFDPKGTTAMRHRRSGVGY